MIAGIGSIITVVEEDTAAQPLMEGTELVTVYVPGVLLPVVIFPVPALIVNPEELLNVPMVAPAFMVGNGSGPFWQNPVVA